MFDLNGFGAKAVAAVSSLALSVAFMAFAIAPASQSVLSNGMIA